jgi:hypothetical protein
MGQQLVSKHWCSTHRLNMVDVLPSPLGNFGLELCFFDIQAFPKKIGGHMLMTKMDRIVILPARPVSQIGQTGSLGKFIWLV